MTNAHSIQSALTHATRLLNDAVTAKLEAQLLLQHALNVNRAWLIAHQNDALEASTYAAYRALINRRVNSEPIAYILGYREFYGLKLKVTPDTLIPRPDTETLVEAALAKIDLMLSPSPPSLPSPQPSPTRGEGVITAQNGVDSSPSPQRGRGVGERGGITILDLGTGTGAIALAIAKHRPQAKLAATDASQAALDIAIENARNLQITNVKFILSDWFIDLKGEKFDIIVSNPPYIAQDDFHLSSGDLPWEPISALVPGQSFSLDSKNAQKEDGLSSIKQIISDAPVHLNKDGWLMLEHGYNQAEAVASLLKQTGFSAIETIKDLGGNDRVTQGKLC